MFQSEALPRQIRGPIVASYQLLIAIGILVSNLINFGVRNIEGSDASWRIVIGLGICFSLPLGIGILFSPESPRWLAGRGRWEEARQSIARIRGVKNDPNSEIVEADFQEMSISITAQAQAGHGSWIEIVTGRPSNIPRLVYRTMLGCAVQFLQQWTGVNYFVSVHSRHRTHVRAKADPCFSPIVLLRRYHLRIRWYRRLDHGAAGARRSQHSHDDPCSVCR